MAIGLSLLEEAAENNTYGRHYVRRDGRRFRGRRVGAGRVDARPGALGMGSCFSTERTRMPRSRCANGGGGTSASIAHERVRIRRAVFAGTRCQERLDGVRRSGAGVSDSAIVKTLVATVARAVEGLHVIVAVERPVARKALVEQHAE